MIESLFYLINDYISLPMHIVFFDMLLKFSFLKYYLFENRYIL